MSRLHEVRSDKKQKVLLVGVLTQGLTEAELNSSLDELARLCQTLGYEVTGRTWQRRPGTGGPLVLGEGKIAAIARLTGGPGSEVALAAAIPNANNPKLKKAFTRNKPDEDDASDDSDDEMSANSETAEPVVEAAADGVAEIGGPRPDLVIFDNELTPSQTRNLEKCFGLTVMDRTGVIIEIFSRHARTRAARLQVEIARLTYVAPRIRETGGGEDRGGGGQGGKGAGETSIELDRRRIRDRIKELKDEFESIGSEHDTRRARRSDVRTVALVGYTNAGKSSLMRVMTGSEVYIADKLFATLDTTVRPIHPATRPQILISDTVGFIKKLPHDLVASFKSTLDEAANASLLLYVVDSSDASFRQQLEVTREVLKEVGAGDVEMKLVLNKADRLTEAEIAERRAEFPDAIIMSTRSTEDLANLRDLIIQHFEGAMVDEEVFVPYTVQGAIGEIRSLMRVLEETFEGGGVRLKVRATSAALARLRARFELDMDERDRDRR